MCYYYKLNSNYMSLFEKTSSCAFQIGNKDYLIQVKVKSKDSSDLYKQKIIRSVISQAIDHQKGGKNITISFDKEKVTFSVGEETPVEWQEKPIPATESAIKIIDFTKQAFERRTRSFQEISQSLLQKWPNKLPFPYFLSYFVITIAAAIKRLFASDVLDTKAMGLHADPHDERALEDAMEEVCRVFSSTGGSDQKELDSFYKGIALAKGWRSTDPQQKKIALDKAADLLSSPGKDMPLISIPGGYWKQEGIFEPILWSFSRDKEGHLRVIEMAYGSDTGETARSYTVKESSEIKIRQMLGNLLALSAKPQEQKTILSSEIIRVGFLKAYQRMYASSDMPIAGPIPSIKHLIDPMNMNRFREALFIEAGGVPIPSSNLPAASRDLLREDPLKLIHETIRLQFPEAPLTDKTLFSLHLLHKRMEKVLAAVPDLTAKERRYWLEKLAQDYKSLERQLEKADMPAQVSQVFEVFEAHLKSLKGEIARVEASSLELQKRRLTRLDHVASKPYEIHIDSAAASQMEPRGPAGMRLIVADLQEVNQLRAAFASRNEQTIPLVLATLKTLTSRVDALVAGRQYESAVLLYRSIMPFLPDPSPVTGLEKSSREVVEAGFWHTLVDVKGDASVLRGRSDQVKALSDELGKLSQYFWEARVKTGTLTLKPDEWIYMLNTEAAMHQLMHIRQKIVELIPEPDRTTEENCFQTLARDYNNDEDYNNGYLYKLMYEAHLRPCENPTLSAKYERISKYLYFNFPNAPDPNRARPRAAATTSKAENELNHCNRIVALVKKREISTLTRNDTRRLWENYLTRGYKEDDLSIPTQFSDLSRHQLMFTSLLFANTAIGEYTGPGFAFFRGIGVGIQTFLGRTSAADGRRKLQLMALAKINQYDRLEIICKRPPGVQDYCIVPRGQSPEDGADVSITPGGVSDIYAFASYNRDKIDDVHADAVGNPDKTYDNHFHSLDEVFSEATALSRALASDSTNPVEDYLLNALKGQKSSLNDTEAHVTFQSLHEVFDLILQRPWLLDKLSKNSQEIDTFEAQKRFYEITFSPSVIRRALEKQPAVFLSHAMALKNLLNRLLQENKTESYFFLLYLTHSVQQHLRLAHQECIDDAKQKELRAILDIWPQMESVSDKEPRETYIKKALLKRHHETRLQNKIDGATYILGMFANDLNGLDPDRIDLLKNREIAGQLLYIGGYLELVKKEATIPVVAGQAVSWMKEHLVPYLYRLDAVQRDEILDSWVAKQVGEVSPGLSWKRVEGETGVFEKNGTLVDLASMQIILFNNKPLDGIRTTLPTEITNNLDYQTLFGPQIYPCFVKAGNAPGEIFYSFKDHQGNSYRAHLTKSTGALVISKEIEISMQNGVEKRWLRYTRPRIPPIVVKPDPSVSRIERWSKKIGMKLFSAEEIHSSIQPEAIGLEKRILAAGIWIDPSQPNQGVGFLGEGDHKMRFNLTFNQKGVLERVTTQDKAYATTLEVIHDRDKRLMKVLACLPPDQVIFLRKPGTSSACEIRFLNQDIILKRKSVSDPWLLSGDERLENASWVMGPDRGDAANKVLHSLGLNIEEVGLTVRKGGQTHLLLWPQKGFNQAAHKKHLIEFDKQYQVNPPLRAAISETGEIVSSSAGYLQLAYLFTLKHNYVKAGYFLDRARAGKIENKQEMELFVAIESHFKELPAASARSAAIRLKGLLAIREIVREQTTRLLFRKEHWDEFLSSSQEIQEAFDQFSSYLKRSPFSRKAEHFEKEDADLSLNAKELSELRHIGIESFSFALTENRRIETVTPKQMHLSIGVPSALEVQQVFPWLLMAKARASKANPKLLENLALNKECVVNHFFELYNLIIEQELTPDQLQLLFGPIAGLNKISLDKVKAQLEQDQDPKANLLQNLPLLRIDIARRLLLTVAAARPKPKGFHLSELDALKKGLPSDSIFNVAKLAYHGFRIYRARNNLKRLEELANGSQAAQVKNLEGLIEQLIPSSHAGEEITTDGFKKADGSLLAQAAALLKEKKGVDIEKFREALREDPTLLGPVFTPLLLTLLSNDDLVNQLKAVSGMVSVDKLVKLVESQTQINLIEVMRDAENKKRIAELEAQVAAQTKSKIDFAQIDPQVQLRRDTFPEALPNFWKKIASAEQERNLKEMAADFATALDKPGLTPIERSANKKLLDGIQTSQVELLAKVQAKSTLPSDQLPALRSAIDAQKSACSERIKGHREALLTYLKQTASSANLPRELRRALKHAGEFGDEAILQLLKQSYQSCQLRDDEAATQLTRLLFEQAAFSVLSGEVETQYNTLILLNHQGVVDSENDWIHAAMRIQNLTDRALNFGRYLDDNGNFKNPSLYRKILVTEASQGIILTCEQIQLIVDIVSSPASWHELKVGLGKTSVVFPIVLLLLIEMGEFPVALVKEELLQQNLDSIDRSTRDLLDKAGVEFSFRLNDPISPSIVQEQYLRLLQVQTNRGYPITSISSILAIDQKLQLLNSDLQRKIDPLIASGLGGIDPKQMKEIDDLQRSIYYLAKIKEKLELILIDEADDIMNVICESNVGLGDPVQLDQTIQNTMEHLMHVVQTSADPEVIKFKEALRSGRQSALVPEWIKEVMIPHLVQGVLEDKNFRVFLNAPEFDIAQMVVHLCTVFKTDDPVPALPPLSAESRALLGALKHIVQLTLPIALRQNPDIDAGVKKSDGFQVGPKIAGAEKTGTVFSDEFDLIVNHFIAYFVKLPEPLAQDAPGESFAEKGLRQVQERHPEVYRTWMTAILPGESLLSCMNRPENYAMRMQFLRLHILDEKRIRRFEKQIVFNVQDICYGRRVRGMTGTLNRDCLPKSSSSEPEGAQMKKVAGQVILEAGLLAKPQVVTAAETAILSQMQTCAKNEEYKSIINQGFYLEKGDSRAIVAMLRQEAPHRIFVFVDTETRKFYLWAPNEAQPRLVSKSELNRYALTKAFKAKACFYFAPPDTRGTDFKIPPGKAAIFLSAKCSLDDDVQTKGRMRGAGTIHSDDLFISQGVEDRIRSLNRDLAPTDRLTYATVVADINHQDTIEQQGKNLKTATQSLKTIVKMGSRQILYGHQPIFDEPDYWDPRSPLIRLFNTLLTRELTQIADHPETGWLEDSRGIHLSGDFDRTVDVETGLTVRQIYENEKAKIARLEAAIRGMNWRAQFIESFGSRFLDEQVLKWIGLRKRTMEMQITSMKRNLDSAFNRFQTELLNEENQIYPATVPSNSGGVPTAQAQVQEIQQTLSQQVELSQEIEHQVIERTKLSRARRVRDHYFRSDPIGDQLFDNLKLTMRNPDQAEVLKNAAAFWKRVPFLHTSRNFNELFNLIRGVKGDLSLCRIMATGDNQVCLITRSDFHHHLDLPWSYRAVYSMVNPKIYGHSMLLTAEAREWPFVSEKDRNEPEKVPLRMVQAKWFLGISDYTTEELALLKPWLVEVEADPVMKLEHAAFLDLFGTAAQKAISTSIL